MVEQLCFSLRWAELINTRVIPPHVQCQCYFCTPSYFICGLFCIRFIETAGGNGITTVITGFTLALGGGGGGGELPTRCFCHMTWHDYKSISFHSISGTGNGNVGYVGSPGGSGGGKYADIRIDKRFIGLYFLSRCWKAEKEGVWEVPAPMVSVIS